MCDRTRDGEQGRFRRERTTNLTNLTNLWNGRIVRNGKLPPGGLTFAMRLDGSPIPLPIRWIRQIRGSS